MAIMTTITAQKAHDNLLADSIARWVGLALGLALIAALILMAASAVNIELPVIGGLLSACSNGSAALNGASPDMADGWAACGAPSGPDADFGRISISD